MQALRVVPEILYFDTFKEFNEQLLQKILYSSSVSGTDDVTTLVLKGGK